MARTWRDHSRYRAAGQESTPRRWVRAIGGGAVLALVAGVFAPGVRADEVEPDPVDAEVSATADDIEEELDPVDFTATATVPDGPPELAPPLPQLSAEEAAALRKSYEDDRWDRNRVGQPTSMALVNQAIGADRLHQAGVDGSGVGVALLDTGVVPVDGLLSPGKVIEGPDLSFESQAPDLLHLDTYGHGTHLAGIIAGAGPGFTGVAPGAQIVSMKLATHDGATDVTQVIAAIDWIVQHGEELGVRVINLAYGTDGIQDYRIDPLSFAVENAWKKGFVVIVSGGNDGPGAHLNNPAYNPYVIAVGASDTRQTPGLGDDVVTSFSSTGDEDRTVDVVAPGQSIVSLRNPGSYADTMYPNARVGEDLFRGSGSSQSAAVVSGAVALLLQQHPDLTPDEVKALLMSTALDLGQDGSGAGALNIHRAARVKLRGDVEQTWPASDGLGSLEAARGTSHVADGGIELIGEIDIFGDEWDGRSWTELSWNGRSWTGGDWLGRSWTGDSWTGRSWTGRSWTGRSWTGDSWAGRSWTGRSWTGRSWTGRSWTGADWAGRSWTGRSWTGRSWTSRTWI